MDDFKKRLQELEEMPVTKLNRKWGHLTFLEIYEKLEEGETLTAENKRLRGLVREMAGVIRKVNREMGSGHKTPEYRAIDLLPSKLIQQIQEINGRPEVREIMEGK